MGSRHGAASASVAFVLATLAAVALGYGGLELGATMPDFTAEAARLSELNREWQGVSEFRPPPALFWLGGHVGGTAGPITIGGRSAFSLRHMAVDAIEVEFAAVQAALDLGWQYAPVEWLTVRPGAEFCGTGWVYYVHDRDGPFREPNFSKWYAAWGLGLVPALELMGRVASDGERYTAVFLKAGHCLPLYGPEWYVDADPPALGIEGWQLHFGLRFGRVPPRHLRI